MKDVLLPDKEFRHSSLVEVRNQELDQQLKNVTGIGVMNTLSNLIRFKREDSANFVADFIRVSGFEPVLFQK